MNTFYFSSKELKKLPLLTFESAEQEFRNGLVCDVLLRIDFSDAIKREEEKDNFSQNLF